MEQSNVDRARQTLADRKSKLNESKICLDAPAGTSARPDHTDLVSSIEVLEADVARYEREVTRWDGVVKAAETADAADVEAAEKKRKAEFAAVYVKELKKRVPLSKALLKQTDDLVSTLTALDEATMAAEGASYDSGLILRGTERDNFLVACGALIAQRLNEAGFNERLVFVQAQRAVGADGFESLDETAMRASDKATAVVRARFDE